MSSVMKTTRDVKGIGLSILRPDAPDKVTGQVQYVADLNPRGLLHAKLLRSPHAHAKIVRIDVSRARALPGVRAVLTAADIPVLKKKAPTRAHAVLALDLIDVQYEVLPVAADPLESMKPGAPPVAELGTEADTSEALAHGSVAGVTTEAKSAKAVNISQQARLQRGDVAKAFAESEVVIEKTYRVPMVHQGYLEPHAVLAQWDSAGNLTLWASTQGSFNTRSEVADVLELSENRIKVIPMECGGGFGGKIRALCEPITAVLARATGRPVRYVMTRREELEAGMPAPQVIIKMKTGVKRDGTLMALEAEAILESGAYSGAVLAVAGVFLASLYLWPNFDVKGFEVLTHKPSIAAYRAPVAPQTIFAIDSHMEQIAKAIGVDPVEFRLRHLQREGDKMANNQPWLSNGAVEVLTRIAEHPLWKKRAEWKASSKDGKLRGTGLSLGGWLGGLQPTGATVRLNPDGTLQVLTGQVDIAGTNIALAQIAATAYGVDIDKVKINTGDTDVAPVTGQVTIHDFVVVQDVGKAINPLGVEGQMQGGAVQSIGMALTEALTFDDQGRLTNPSLLDYKKLTAADLPNIETIIVEKPAPAGPFGARGVGEPPIVPAPAALANAIHDATGVRLTELPLTPERIALAMARSSR